MKKKILFCLLLAIIINSIFAQKEWDVELLTTFRINPITGINGDDKEASSKFVQRLIFSPLVFPLQDPYLQDTYPVAIEWSLIEKMYYRDVNTKQWVEYDLNFVKNNPKLDESYNTEDVHNPNASEFRVKLRDNLHFARHIRGRRGGVVNWEPLNALDVVYSYRTAIITMERMYKEYLDNKTARLNMNTLLYSKIKNFNEVNVFYSEHKDMEVQFIIGREITCRNFFNLLAYVPILSARQLLDVDIKKNESSDKTRQLRMSNFSSVLLVPDNTLNNVAYDLYDMRKTIINEKTKRLTKAGEDFYKNPAGYGQFIVESINTDLRDIDDQWHNITLIKNADWCKFNEIIEIGNNRFNHQISRGKSDTLKITRSNDNIITMLGQINESNPTKILYNIPLSTSLFNEYGDLGNISNRTEKLPMQISHYLYGIYFGPNPANVNESLNPEARKFFNMIADRVRFENIIRYIPRGEGFSGFHSNAATVVTGSITANIDVQRLYFPFYISKEADNVDRDNLGKLYDKLEEEDNFYREYISEIGRNDLIAYYKNLAEMSQNDIPILQSFYNNFIGGSSYMQRSGIPYLLDEQFEKARNHILKRDGSVSIQIFIPSNDTIALSIANHFRAKLDSYFARRLIPYTIPEAPTVIISNIDESFLKEWKRISENRAKEGVITFLVRGWNYRFDLLDEIKPEYQFIDNKVREKIQDHYDDLVKGRTNLVNQTVYLIANEFSENNIMIPLVGLQNYSIFYKGGIPAFENYNDIEMMLLPFYWSDGL